MTKERTTRYLFKSGAWFLLVALLVFLAFAVHGSPGLKLNPTSSQQPYWHMLFTALPVLLAVALAQQIISANSIYSPTFSAVIAAFAVMVISAFEFLLLIVPQIFMLGTKPT